MSTTEVSYIAQTVPKTPSQRPQASQKDNEPVTPASAVAAFSAKEKQPSPIDTVTILTKQLQIKAAQEHDAAKKESEAKSGNKQERTIGDVQFAYNFKGDLRVRFMDRGNHLIYQIPPELVARVAETISQPNSAVDTTA